MADDRPASLIARWDGDDLLLPVRVVPRASADAVVPEQDCLKVRLTAPPVEGRANAALCRVLSRLFGVPKSRVVVERGTGSRMKLVRVVAPVKIPDYLRR